MRRAKISLLRAFRGFQFRGWTRTQAQKATKKIRKAKSLVGYQIVDVVKYGFAI